MTVEVFDLETYLISPNVPCPKMVCCAYENRVLVPWEGESPYALFDRLVRSPDLIVNHNVVGFDLAIVAVESPTLFVPIWEKLRAGLVRDTQIREQLYRIAKGEARYEIQEEDAEEDEPAVKTRFDLAATAQRWLGEHVEKKDTFRLKYGELFNVPLAEWPAEAISYPVRDVDVTRRVWDAQCKAIGPGDLPDEHDRCLRAWALKLTSMWGVRTHADFVDRLRADLSKREADGIAELLPTECFRVGGTKKKPKYVRTASVVRARVEAAYAASGEEVPKTKKGATSTSRKTKVESGDPILYHLAEVERVSKIRSGFVPVLEIGTKYPIHAGYNVLVASGRGSCRSPNWQQLPKWPGVRECVVARPGHVFAVADFEMAELCSMAQVCIDLVGFSVLGEQINAGLKPIMAFAAKLAGCTYDEALVRYRQNDPDIKKARQDSKAALYGLPGYMQPKKLKFTANAQGNSMTLERAQTLSREWRAEYPEFPAYFDYVKAQIGHHFGATGTITQLRSGRLRGGCNLPEACNTYFQGLMGDAAMEAHYNVTEECYLVRDSALYGSRPVWFVHDESAVETPIAQAPEAAERLVEVMALTARKWLPDIKIGAEPILLHRWSKEAKPKRVNGVLIPSDESVW